MSQVYFEPWVGKQFGSEAVKLLLLGESHYYDGSPPPTFTIDLIRQYMNGEWTHRYWTQIMQAVCGKSYKDIDKHLFWNKIAFYNYIQEIVGPSPGLKPTNQMIEAAVLPFYDILNQLKPTHLLVLSKRLWEYLPSDLEDKVKATWLHHPSYGFSAPQWHPLVAKFLTQ